MSPEDIKEETVKEQTGALAKEDRSTTGVPATIPEILPETIPETIIDAKDIKERVKDRFFQFVRFPLSVMPLWVESIGAGVIISEVIDRHPRFKARLSELNGKIFQFEARDIKKRFNLVIKDGEIKIVPHIGREPDVIMRGDVRVLTDLFTGAADPDTVFFSRRLEINGDTSAAIHLKNLLANM